MIEQQTEWDGTTGLDRWILRDGAGLDLGGCKLIGGSWECIYNQRIVAYRPSLESAKRVIERIHAQHCGAETE